MNSCTIQQWLAWDGGAMGDRALAQLARPDSDVTEEVIDAAERRIGSTGSAQ